MAKKKDDDLPLIIHLKGGPLDGAKLYGFDRIPDEIAIRSTWETWKGPREICYIRDETPEEWGITLKMLSDAMSQGGTVITYTPGEESTVMAHYRELEKKLEASNAELFRLMEKSRKKKR